MADVNDVFAAPARATEVNIVGTVNVLEAARQADAGRVILASTVWVYAATSGERVDETTRFDPDTNRHLYVSTKIAAELSVATTRTCTGGRSRSCATASPTARACARPRARVVRAGRWPARPLRIDGDGRQDRNFVYVEDLAQAYVMALRPEAENQTVNLDGPEPVSIRRLAELTQELVPGALVEFGRRGPVTSPRAS